MGADAWVSVATGLLGAFTGGAAVYASVAARLAVLESKQQALATQIDAAKADVIERTESQTDRIVELVKALLSRPGNDRRAISRGQ